MIEHLPLAAADEWLKYVGIIIVVGGSMIARVMNEREKRKPKPPRSIQRVPPPPPRPQVRTPQDEVSDFLRRAAELRRGDVREVEVVDMRSGRRGTAAMPTIVAAEVAPGGQSRESVAAHVKQRLGSQRFEAREKNLSEIVKVDQQIESHLHQVFDHQISRIAAQSGEAAAPIVATVVPASTAQPSTPSSWVALFANPDSVKQAIVLNEILTRPESRWE
jgi:hypothetical protein